MTHSDLLQRLATIVPAGLTGLLTADGWVPATGEGTFPVTDPATGETLREVADATEADAVAALDAAVEAGPAWAATSPRERAEVLRRAFELVTERTEEIATVITLEMGKSLAEARGEVAYGAEFLRWFSEEAVRLEGCTAPAPGGGATILTRRRPVGPVLAITPWNFPLAMGTRKIGPALAAGCSVVLKPAGATPLTAILLMEILREAGLPDGVVTCFTTSRTSEVVAPVLADPRLRKLTFTGSTEVGRTLLGQTADNLLRSSMELGGNAPFVVLDDADLDAAVEGAMAAKFRNIGQACTAANRFIVHREVAQEFTERLAEAAAARTVGPGGDEGADLGPLLDADALTKVERLVDDAVAAGAGVVTGGPEEAAALAERLPEGGHWYPPTVLAGVPRGAACLAEEIFGPVAPIIVVEDDDEALELANDTEFGLVGYVYGSDLQRLLAFAGGMETGMVGVNRGVVSEAAAPFGGVKHSGLGREGGHEGVEEYLETQYLGLTD
ncbi:succinate semialdehyde dehydrogenase [Kytococcus aerolatus]|uniref:Succinate semialdehyde dehydrogenase n=1 Tax=Kytococcus aerolatus TaxID=592308 RepID=A0A212U1Y3_9MICO|nr:NAD-dependent succinate-semialdehyde dehydrogenase [Kytococcus aerolatus]SNC72248.1 succinate semialdehyde dehydrogenase [Kytococcus aerolatus]